MSNRPWFKPPPLESIQVNNNELNGNFILRICALLNLFTGFTGMLGLLVLSMTVYVSLNVFNALDMTFILIFINNWPLYILHTFYTISSVSYISSKRGFVSYNPTLSICQCVIIHLYLNLPYMNIYEHLIHARSGLCSSLLQIIILVSNVWDYSSLPKIIIRIYSVIFGTYTYVSYHYMSGFSFIINDNMP